MDQLSDDALTSVYDRVDFRTTVRHFAVCARFRDVLPSAVKHIRGARALQRFASTVETADLSRLNEVDVPDCPNLRKLDVRYCGLDSPTCRALGDRFPEVLTSQYEYLCACCRGEVAKSGDFYSYGTYGPYAWPAIYLHDTRLEVRGRPCDRTLSTGRYSLVSELHCPTCDAAVGGWKYLRSYDGEPHKEGLFLIAHDAVVMDVPSI